MSNEQKVLEQSLLNLKTAILLMQNDKEIKETAVVKILNSIDSSIELLRKLQLVNRKGYKWREALRSSPAIDQLVLIHNKHDNWTVCGYLNKNGKWYNQFENEVEDIDVLPTHWIPFKF